jgi:hypothetical protein
VEIPEFAATLKAGDFRAVDVTQHQVINKEHSFNNCNELICLYESGGPRRCSLLALPPHGICFSDQCTLILSGETFDEGYYLVKIHWLEFVNVDSAYQRRYRVGEEHMLSTLCFASGRLSYSRPPATLHGNAIRGRSRAWRQPRPSK